MPAQLLVAPKFLVGLTCIGGLARGCTEGHAILVVIATVAGVVRVFEPRNGQTG